MDIKNLFDETCRKVWLLTDVNEKNKLVLYGLYKQSLLGDNTEPLPSFYKIKKRKKWEAWKKNQGISPTDSMKMYIIHVNKLMEQDS